MESVWPRRARNFTSESGGEIRTNNGISSGDERAPPAMKNEIGERRTISMKYCLMLRRNDRRPWMRILEAISKRVPFTPSRLPHARVFLLFREMRIRSRCATPHGSSRRGEDDDFRLFKVRERRMLMPLDALVDALRLKLDDPLNGGSFVFDWVWYLCRFPVYEASLLV